MKILLWIFAVMFLLAYVMSGQEADKSVMWEICRTVYAVVVVICFGSLAIIQAIEGKKHQKKEK